jgi:hypothetical protein
MKHLLDEVAFFLKNDGQGYIEYTSENSAKWDSEKKFK